MAKRHTGVFANKATGRFHRADRNNDACRVSEIKKANLIWFETAAEARRAGYVGCRRCFVNMSK